jgi:acyl-CoA thioester hydrolase
MSTDGPDVTLRIALTESDIDDLGHLNQARYHGLLGQARQRLLSHDFAGAPGREGTFVLAHAELDYYREVRLADAYVDARARIVRVGTKSVTIENELLRPEGALAARGSVVMVAWDRDARRSRDISAAERAAYGAATLHAPSV